MERFLTVEEVAKKFGVHRATVLKWRSRKVNPLPYYKQGGSVRYKESELVEWFTGKNEKGQNAMVNTV